jgi:hypothetical protein
MSFPDMGSRASRDKTNATMRTTLWMLPTPVIPDCSTIDSRLAAYGTAGPENLKATEICCRRPII